MQNLKVKVEHMSREKFHNAIISVTRTALKKLEIRN